MIKRIFASLAALSIAASSPAFAAATVGSMAPDFSLEATTGGARSTFSLASARRLGPVVVYFYPAAFTGGCTIEAHLFAEAIEDFRKAGASVIGVSGDPIAKLDEFSKQKCQSKFPLGSDAKGEVIRAYDVRSIFGARVADRVSFVVAPDGKVLLRFKSGDPKAHIDAALAAVRAWKSAAKAG